MFTHLDHMWKEASAIIAATEEHPFLNAMLDGSLSMEKFQFYIMQDALYLAEFGTALRRLASRPGINEEDSKTLNMFADRVDEAEAGLHQTFFNMWGKTVEDIKALRPCPNTLLYTSYLKSVVATECHAEGLASLLPCFWVYMHVGKILVEKRSKVTTKLPAEFDRWIDMYGGEDFEQSVVTYKRMVERAADQSDQTTRQRMLKHFVKSCELEWMFWNAALTLQAWPSFDTTN